MEITIWRKDCKKINDNVCIHKSEEYAMKKPLIIRHVLALAALSGVPAAVWAGVVAANVPEPNVLTLIALGGVAVLLVNRARKK
jgi:hypothetical protein